MTTHTQPTHLTKTYVAEALERAQEAFWAQVAKDFQEVQTGDFPPDADYPYRASALRVWLWGNHPEFSLRDGETEEENDARIDDFLRETSE